MTISMPDIHLSQINTGIKFLNSGNASPLELGVTPYAGWDAFLRPDLITSSGGAVSSWKDIIAALDAVQGTGASRPTLSGTWIYGDGVDDELTVTGTGAIPVGANPGEEWYRVDQREAIASTTTGTTGCIGGSANSVGRRLNRTSLGRASIVDTGPQLINNSVYFFGKQVIRLIYTGTTVDIEVDGISAGGTAQVSAISTVRIRFFANLGATAGAFANVGIAARWFMPPLNATQAAGMRAYMGGIP